MSGVESVSCVPASAAALAHASAQPLPAAATPLFWGGERGGHVVIYLISFSAAAQLET